LATNAQESQAMTSLGASDLQPRPVKRLSQPSAAIPAANDHVAIERRRYNRLAAARSRAQAAAANGR
jgi:hypothetical protein